MTHPTIPEESGPLLCECGRRAELVTGQVIYPGRADLYTKRFWLCDPCDAYVGCHPGSTRPLGTLAGPELRRARMRAHNALDPLWRHAEDHYPDLPKRKIRAIRNIARSRVYRWLSLRLGIPEDQCHIGQSDVETCEAIVQALQVVDYPRIRKEVR